MFKDTAGRPLAESVANLTKDNYEPKNAVDKLTKDAEISRLMISSLEKEL